MNLDLLLFNHHLLFLFLHLLPLPHQFSLLLLYFTHLGLAVFNIILHLLEIFEHAGVGVLHFLQLLKQLLYFGGLFLDELQVFHLLCLEGLTCIFSVDLTVPQLELLFQFRMLILLLGNGSLSELKF